MKLLINNEIEDKFWNEFVGDNLFHKYEWYFVIKNTYKLKPFFIICYDNDKFALIGSFKVLNKYISLPYVNYSGFLYNDVECLNLLKKTIKENKIYLESRELIEDNNDNEGIGYVNPIVEINTFDDFWNSISSKTRNQFRKASKFGYYCLEENSLENFYKIYTIGMHKFGTPCHGLYYFKQLQKFFNTKIFTILIKNNPIGSMFCIYNNKYFSIMYAYVLPEYSKNYANYFLYLHAIRWITKNNILYLDLGRSMYGSGTYYFKKKFRPKMYKIKSKTNYSTNKKLIFFSNIWKLLPFSVTKFLGPKVRKYLP